MPKNNRSNGAKSHTPLIELQPVTLGENLRGITLTFYGHSGTYRRSRLVGSSQPEATRQSRCFGRENTTRR
jgi:hypothetical protein